MAGRCYAGHGRVWQCKEFTARLSESWFSTAMRSWARQAIYGMARYGDAMRGKIGSGAVMHGMARNLWPGEAMQDLAGRGMARIARHGK